MIYEEITKTVLTSLALQYILADVLNVGYYYKKLFKIPLHKIIKPWDCLPCFTFWLAIVYQALTYTEITIATASVSASYLIALYIDKKINA
jgi:hypothetical protein